MSRKILLFAVLIILFPVFTIYAQEEALKEATETEEAAPKPSGGRPDFWISLGADTAFYTVPFPSYGGSFSFGYGSGSSIGIKAAYFFNAENFNIFEIDLLLRFYLLGKDSYQGAFIQLIGGATLLNYHDKFSIPSNTGIINAGLSFGWRFVFINRLFAEAAVRAGYPYFAGLNLSAGVRF